MFCIKKQMVLHDGKHADSCRERQSSMKAFLRATARGYESAAADPLKASTLLVEESRGALDKDFALKSQEYASKVLPLQGKHQQSDWLVSVA